MDEAAFIQLAKHHRHIALFREASADHVTPIQALLTIRGECLLESSPQDQLGRHSYVGADPIHTICDPTGGFDALKEFKRGIKAAVSHPLALYTGGLVGFVSYDAIRYREKIPDRHRAQKDIPDLHMSCYRTSVIFDHATGKLVMATLVDVGDDPAGDYERGEAALDRLEEQLSSPQPLPPLKKKGAFPVGASLDDEEYQRLVAAAKEYIRSGDVFQLVLSRSFHTEVQESGLDLYRALRQQSPAPYHFYFDRGDTQILGASPEQLIAVKQGVVHTSPIAGTRPIHGDPNELLSDPKEVAEHMMLVDLGRNDLGAVCKPGSVKVKKLLEVQKFTHVMHIVSTIEGTLKETLDPIDAFVHAFPAGTLTGAPKVRAMELIDDLEKTRRGLYGGAILAIEADGDLDSCIAIRMGVLKGKQLTVRAGAGIVFDSVPQTEADETRHKAKTVLVAAQGRGA